jgi:hypothetical protein
VILRGRSRIPSMARSPSLAAAPRCMCVTCGSSRQAPRRDQQPGPRSSGHPDSAGGSYRGRANTGFAQVLARSLPVDGGLDGARYAHPGSLKRTALVRPANQGCFLLSPTADYAPSRPYFACEGHCIVCSEGNVCQSCRHLLLFASAQFPFYSTDEPVPDVDIFMKAFLPPSTA